MKIILITLALAIAAVVLLGACKNQSSSMKSNSKVKDLWLNSHRPSPKLNVYLAQFDSERTEDAWQELVIPIEGFTYTAGHVYHLQVEELAEVEGRMMYRLVKIVSTQIDPLLAITDIYVLSEIPGGLKAEELRDVRCTVELNASTRTVMGAAPCNQYSGSIDTLTQTAISFGPMMATKMACPNLKAEQLFFKRMAEVTGYTRKGMLLHLTGKDNKSLLVLRKVD